MIRLLRILTVAACGVILAMLGARHIDAQARTEVDLALVLAVDMSNSVDRAETALQRAGGGV